MQIAGVASALPSHYFKQAEVAAALMRHWRDRVDNPAVLERLLSRVGVDGRHFALPLEAYDDLDTFGKSNDQWIATALELGEKSLCRALSNAGISKDDLGAIFMVSVTGIASPSIEARLINRMQLPRDIKRVPIFGLGCVAGAAGISRAADYVRAYPADAAALICVELCSLTWQRNDLSVANLISSGLFGDGAAAVVVTGRELDAAPGPQVIASRSSFYPGTEDVMGWNISEDGFRIVLSPNVPEMVFQHLAADVRDFLADNGIDRSQIGSWIMHTGGPKVLEATQAALELPDSALELSWECLRNVGNLSSASVLLVLESFIKQRRPEPGTYGLLAAMGPGFCAELVLLRW